MTLDELAWVAAARTRQEAADLGRVDLNRYRRGRQRRNGMLFGAAAVAALVIFLVAIAVPPPIEKTAVTVVTTPEFPSSTLPSPPTTSPSGPETILGAGWEEIDAGPVAGRYRMAAVWTDHGLFVFGGHDNYRLETPASALFHHDGYLYDPDTGWSALPEAGQELFEVGEANALSMGDAVLVYGRPRAQFSNRAAIFDLAKGRWDSVAPDFGNALEPDTELVWTGELIVAPTLGLAYDRGTGLTIEIPTATPSAYGYSSPLRGYWTGSEVVVIGSGQVQVWSPGESAWRTQGHPGIGGVARDSVWVGGALWVVNYEMSVARWGGAGWSRPGDLPLRFFECVPEAVAVELTPVVRTCSGIAIWDAARESWLPVPLEDLGYQIRESGVLVGGDAIYSVGGPTLRRFLIERDETGAIIPPHSVPIGWMQLRIPPDWEWVASVAPEQHADGTIPDDETIGLVFESGVTTCRVASTYPGADWVPPPEADLIGGIALGPTGELAGTAYWVPGFEENEWGVLFAVPDPRGHYWVTIHCSSPDQDSLIEPAASFGYLWSPWDPPIESPEVIVGPGWDTLDGGPIAGRMRIAAAWTGQEIFVWGGHDGYIQETPGPEAFHQDAYLFDPTTDTWRPAAPPPDELCAFTVTEVIPLDGEVLLRGLAPDRDGCSQAAIYTPEEDRWRLVDGPLFNIFYFDTDLVWTGEWLAAPRAGLAWVQSDGTNVGFPPVADGDFHVASPVDAHWTGDRMVAVGAGDIHVFTPGDDQWTTIPGPPITGGGRVSVWSQDGLVVAESGHLTALLDDQDQWIVSSLPLRDDECTVELLVAAERPVASTCSGMAIWDPVRRSWIPIPVSAGGWSWMPVVVGSYDAIYALGEGFHRFPIEYDGGGANPAGLADPVSIPVGLALLDTHGFHVLNTIGWSQVLYPGDFIGYSILVNLIGSEGDCEVISTFEGPPLAEPERVIDIWGYDVMVLPSERSRPTLSGSQPMTHLAIRTGNSDVVHIHCESEDDALTLARSLSIP